MIDFSRVPNTSLPGRLLRLPLRFIPEGVAVPVLQGPLRGARWITGSSTHGCWLGWYEAEKQRVLHKILDEGHVFYDVGAHVGFYSLLAARIVGPSGAVVAFEPLPRNVGFLNRHLATNRVDNVEVRSCAVSSRSGVVGFTGHPGPSEAHIATDGELQVEAVSLDLLVQAGEIPRPDVVKIDVEGAEIDVIHGAANLIQETRPVLLVATHGSRIEDGCVRLLQLHGYVLRRLTDQRCGSGELAAFPEGSSWSAIGLPV